jgi:hypothetical protein
MLTVNAYSVGHKFASPHPLGAFFENFRRFSKFCFATPNFYLVWRLLLGVAPPHLILIWCGSRHTCHTYFAACADMGAF